MLKKNLEHLASQGTWDMLFVLPTLFPAGEQSSRGVCLFGFDGMLGGRGFLVAWIWFLSPWLLEAFGALNAK